MAGDIFDANALGELIRNRRSVRVFEKKPVPTEIIEELIEIAGQAPSVMNIQPWHFSVVQGDQREKVLAIMRQSSVFIDDSIEILDGEDTQSMYTTGLSKEIIINFYDSFGNAPAFIIVSIKKVANEYLKRQMLVSCGGAIQNLMLSASAGGLATCCVGFSVWVGDKLMQAVDMPDMELVTVIPIGYPATKPNPVPRKTTDINWIGP